MHIDAVGAFCIVLFNVIFWFLTFPKERPSNLAKAYFWWSFFITLWALGYGVTLAGFLNHDTTLIWNKYCQAMAMLIGPFFFRFGCTVVNQQEERKNIFRVYLGFGLINAVLLFVTDLYVKGLWSFGKYVYQPLGGPLYVLFTAFFVCSTVHAYVIVARRYRHVTGVRRKQVSLWLLATGIAYSGGISLFLQAYRIPLPTHGVFCILAYVVVIAYAIHKYQFMDIPVLVRRTLVFAGLLSFAFGVFVGTTLITQELLSSYLGAGSGRFLSLFVSAFLVILGYEPLRKYLINLTDKFLFQKKFDYQKLLKDASAGISRIKSLDHLLNLVVHFITMRVRVRNAAVLVYDQKDHSFYLSHPRGYPGDYQLLQAVTLGWSDPLIRFLDRERVALDIERIKERLDDSSKKQDAKQEKEAYDYSLIRARMEALGASCCVPSFLGKRLKNILVLGEKKSGDFYTEQDLDVLFTLAQESAIAIENAQLYDEAITRSRELQAKSTELQMKSDELFGKTVELERKTTELERKKNEVEQTNEQLEGAQTELVRALGEMDRTNKRLQQTQSELMEAKKRALLAGISSAVGHEIRNPLTPMMGQIYYILKTLDGADDLLNVIGKKLNNEERARFLKFVSTLNERFSGVQRGTDRIKGVVNTLIDLVKDRSEKKGEVQLKLVVASALEEVRFQTYWESLTVPKMTITIPATLPFIRGITQDLQGVFVNLIINALHAMEKTTDKQIKIQACIDPDNDKMIRVDFSDNGSGISEALQKKIFEHRFTTKGDKGTGIGLFYCKDNIERVHGGSLSVTSEAGKGTTFTMKLPIYERIEKAGGGETSYGNVAHR
jgi:signal transduction histidine kinase